MNDIEQLVRDSLRSTPVPQTQVADPVAVIGRRAARARAFFAGAAVAAAAVITAAIVVPLQLVDREHGPGRVGPVSSPSPTASTAPAPTTWADPNLKEVVSGGRWLWTLAEVFGTNDSSLMVEKLDPLSHEARGKWPLAEPGSFLSYGLARIWVTGGGDGAYPDGALQVLDPRTGSVHSLSSSHQQLSGVAFTAGHAWVLAGRAVWEVDADGRHVGTVVLPTEATQRGIVATDSGQLWVQTSASWLRIDVSTQRVVDTVRWSGPMLGAAGGDAIWTYDGRLVALSPALTHQGQSVAEGTRIVVPGPVSEARPSSNGGLFVVARAGPNPDPSSLRLYFLGERQLKGGAAIDDRTPSVPAGYGQLAPDDAGGVNYLTSESPMHWTP